MKLASLSFALFLAVSTGLFAQAQLAPLPQDGFVTLQQIVSDFSSQPDAALQKYQGRSVLVYGRVGQLQQSDDSDGDPLTVFLQLPNNTTPDVKCVFQQVALPKGDQNAQLNVTDDGTEAVIAHRENNRKGKINYERPFISEGQMVGIRGTFDNFNVGDVVLKDCRKLRPEFLKRALRENHVDDGQ